MTKGCPDRMDKLLTPGMPSWLYHSANWFAFIMLWTKSMMAGPLPASDASSTCIPRWTALWDSLSSMRHSSTGSIVLRACFMLKW